MVGFLLVSFIKYSSSPDRISYTTACPRPEAAWGKELPTGRKSPTQTQPLSTIRVHLPADPLPPFELILVTNAKTPDNVAVSWAKQNASFTNAWFLQQRRLSDPQGQYSIRRLVNNASRRSLRMDSLTPGETYSVQVFAESNKVRSLISAETVYTQRK